MTQNLAQKQELSDRQILFPKKKAQPQKFEEDIILAYNKTLQKAGELVII